MIIRINRQIKNNKKVYHMLKNKKIDKKHINFKEYQRTLLDLGINENQFLKESENDVFAKLASRHLSIKASRQGAFDEKCLLNNINKVIKNYGTEIKILPNNKFFPSKQGKIEDKKLRYSTLKSFDARIIGKIKGWIFIKFVYGNGGHQDNVFNELNEYCEWCVKFGKEELYIGLIETNLIDEFDRLKKKYQYTKNILLCDHRELQKFIIANSYS